MTPEASLVPAILELMIMWWRQMGSSHGCEGEVATLTGVGGRMQSEENFSQGHRPQSENSGKLPTRAASPKPRVEEEAERS